MTELEPQAGAGPLRPAGTVDDFGLHLKVIQWSGLNLCCEDKFLFFFFFFLFVVNFVIH